MFKNKSISQRHKIYIVYRYMVYVINDLRANLKRSVSKNLVENFCIYNKDYF